MEYIAHIKLEYLQGTWKHGNKHEPYKDHFSPNGCQLDKRSPQYDPHHLADMQVVRTLEDLE